MSSIEQLKIKIFADGADKTTMLEMYQSPLIKGFTTNPTLMRKAGVSNYEDFAIDILQTIHDRPISFEVFSDDFNEMYYQALHISQWGKNVFVKIPVTNTKGELAFDLIRKLSKKGIKLNVTALMTIDQVYDASAALADGPEAFISVFAGRVADTGRDPLPLMIEALKILSSQQQLELIWASPRELLNVFQGNEIGCHVITLTHDILKKFHFIGKDLDELSLDTVKMFRDDAIKAGFSLIINEKLA